MRLPTVVALVAFAAPVVAADKDEDKAKEAAAALVKAVKAKDIDAFMKLSDVPFLIETNGKPGLIEKADDLKADLTKKFEELKDTSKVPTQVKEVLDLAAIRKKAENKDDEAVLKLVEKALGEKGYAVIVSGEGTDSGAILVRIKDGKVKVVGILD